MLLEFAKADSTVAGLAIDQKRIDALEAGETYINTSTPPYPINVRWPHKSAWLSTHVASANQRPIL